MRVLVTGGAGFIGSHFVKRLAATGDEVVVLDKLTYSGNLANLDGVEHAFVHGDIADPIAVSGAGEGCTAVVNFAAESHVDRSILAAGDFVRTDVLGTEVLLEWARTGGARFVQVSTDEVYGDVSEGRSAKEDDPLQPYGIDAVITRGANTYGPFQYPEKLIPLFITNSLEGEPLPVYGDGRQRREWVHAEDHCAAIEFVLREGASGSVYNVGGDERENLEITERILELAGADPGLVRHVEDRPGHDRRYSVDSSRIEKLGWRRTISFETGLAETFAWYRDRRDWWEPIKSGEYAAYYREQYASRLGQ